MKRTPYFVMESQESATMETSTSHSSPVLDAADLHDAIRRRAEEIYIESGRIPGRDLANWAQAEREVMTEAASRKRRAVIVKVDGVQYVCEYRPESSDGYLPGEFTSGSAVPVRLQGDKMFIQRPNGKILETTIVRTMS